jgi:hypothetical protein
MVKMVGDDDLFEVEKVVGKKIDRKTSKTFYLIKWQGYTKYV